MDSGGGAWANTRTTSGVQPRSVALVSAVRNVSERRVIGTAIRPKIPNLSAVELIAQIFIAARVCRDAMGKTCLKSSAGMHEAVALMDGAMTPRDVVQKCPRGRAPDVASRKMTMARMRMRMTMSRIQPGEVLLASLVIAQGLDVIVNSVGGAPRER